MRLQCQLHLHSSCVSKRVCLALYLRLCFSGLVGSLANCSLMLHLLLLSPQCSTSLCVHHSQVTLNKHLIEQHDPKPLPAPPLSPAPPRPCRDLCVPSPCTARKCTFGRCGRTAPGLSDAAGRSACPGDRFHRPVCAS